MPGRFLLFDLKGTWEIMRKEHDFLGELEVPDEAYYGVQTMRAVENFSITGRKLDVDFIQAMA